MRAAIHPLQVLLLTVSGWVNRHQQDVIAYLLEENRVLKEQFKGRSLRLAFISPGRPIRLASYVHFSAINRLCQRMIVSGVTMVATLFASAVYSSNTTGRRDHGNVQPVGGHREAQAPLPRMDEAG